MHRGKGWIEELIDEEFGRTITGVWNSTTPGEKSVLFGSSVINPFGVASTHGLCA
jgi:hypothetical protein